MSSKPGKANTARHGPIQVFRGRDAEGVRPASQRGAVRSDKLVHSEVTAGLKRLGDAGFGTGATARVLYESDDLHIGYVWFKSGFPLPLHSHDADCFYQIIAGSMRVGTAELRSGDGVLIPADTPYTVTPGEAGVEFIEVRPTHDYDTDYKRGTEKYWNKLVEIATARQDVWAGERPPYDMLRQE